MIEKFYNMLMEMYGDEYEDDIEMFFDWVAHTHGNNVELDDLFVYWSDTIIQARIMREL